jgi:3',5'-cyclic AMP phosphodiesterase CpdA
MKRFFLTLLFSLVISSCCFAEYYSFAVFSDTHSRFKVFKDIVDSMANDKSIQFAILAGDFTDRGTPAEYAEYKKFKKTSIVPIHELLGNHDIGRNGQGREIFKKWHKGGRYYYFDIASVRYILIDDSDDAGLGKDQWVWLNKVLDTNKTKLVFLHKPVVDPTQQMPKHVMYPTSERIELNDLFVKNKVKYVFSGHIHGYGRLEENGVIYVDVAGGGGTLYLPAFSGGFYHYVKVTVDDNGITDEVVKLYEN